jgi:uncharacterized protein (TIGR02118 family)
MYRLTVLYGRPEDPQAFDSYYRDVHIPLAREMRGLVRWTLTSIDQAGDGTTPYHLIADLYTADRAGMQRVLNSPEGKAARADVPNFATGGVTFLEGDEEEVQM